MTTEELLNMVAEAWPINAKEYPVLAKMPQTPKTRQGFGVAHANLHIMKSCGAVAALVEGSDHSGFSSDVIGGGDNNDLRKLAIKQVLNALRLAELTGVTGEDIEIELRMRLAESISHRSESVTR